MCYTDPAQPLTTAGEELDGLYPRRATVLDLHCLSKHISKYDFLNGHAVLTGLIMVPVYYV